MAIHLRRQLIAAVENRYIDNVPLSLLERRGKQQNHKQRILIHSAPKMTHIFSAIIIFVWTKFSGSARKILNSFGSKKARRLKFSDIVH